MFYAYAYAFAPPRSTLNHLAKPYKPLYESLAYSNHPESIDKRSLYLTFSNGFPLNESEIFNFFNLIVGMSCVVDVYVHRPRTGRGPSLFGRVVFRTPYMVEHFMKNKEKITLAVNGVPLYCKRYVSRQRT